MGSTQSTWEHTKFSRANLATNRHLRSSHHQHAVVVPTLAPSHQEAVASASKLKQVQICGKTASLSNLNELNTRKLLSDQTYLRKKFIALNYILWTNNS